MSTLTVQNIQGSSSSNNTISVADGHKLDVTLVKAEGTATTNLQQGLSKWWCAVIQATNTVKDSFNVSGTTDTGTGRTQYGYTNNMANDGYSVVGTSRDGGGYNDIANCNSCTDSTYSSSQVELFCTHGASSGAGTPNDTNGPLWATAHGDLA